MMLYADCMYASLLLGYIIVSNLRLICYAWNSSRLEAKQHMCYFITVALSLCFSLPLIINDVVFFSSHTGSYTDWRIGYYSDWFAKTMPPFIYILFKPAEDCFACFNRLAPQPYSICQYA